MEEKAHGDHTTHHAPDTTTERVLFVAFELSEKTWQLGFTTGHGQQPRERSIAACTQARLLQDVAQATKRCGLPDTAPVVRCSEAGREGFWLHRFLQRQGITNSVVDSSSLEVNRRRRRAKRDGWDVRKLVSMLRRYAHPQFLSQQMAELEAARRALRQPSQEAALEQVRQLRHLGGTCT